MNRVKTYAPIAVFAYNRLDKIKRCIKALEKCELASDSDLYIFADGYKSDKDKKAVEEVQRWVSDYSSNSAKAFRSVHAEIKEKNMGLANSIISGVTKLICAYEKVIVVEDDLIVAPAFLKYMNEGLSFYEDQTNIWAMASYGYDLKSLKHYHHDVYMGYRASSWGWATWKDRWGTVDWDVSDYAELTRNKEMQKIFCRGGGDLYPMLQRQMRGESDSWAVRWNYAASKQNKLTVYPKHGLVCNEGFDGTGTHSGLKAPDAVYDGNNNNISFEILPLDRKIAREFQRMHTDTIDKKIKRNASFHGIRELAKRILKL